MKSDPLFYRFFSEVPACFFSLIGRPGSDAQRYDLNSIEYKETAVRLDGVFQPRHPDVDPAYLWEVQYYPSDRVYANLIAKIGRFLEHGDPSQDWVAVVIYANRKLEQKNLRPYRWLIKSDQLVRIYLDELAPAPPDNFEIGVLDMIVAEPQIALEQAKATIPQLRASEQSPQYKRQMIQLIATVIWTHFPQWSSKEVEKMLKIHDIRETRVFQEALEEGVAKGIAIEKENAALALLKIGRPIAEIAQALGLTLAQIRKLKKNHKIK